MKKHCSVSGLLYGVVLLLSTTVHLSAAEPALVSPINNDEVSLAPPAQLEYLSPEQRGWDTPYSPEDAKKGAKDTTQPNPVQFQWNWDGNESVVFTLQISTNAECNDCLEFVCDAQTSYAVSNLNIGTQYYWRVKAVTPDETTCSVIGQFKTAAILPRWYNVPSITNVRDAGGWKTADGKKKVKMGKIFRGSQFDQSFTLEPEGKKIVLEDLGIRTDLDLRGAKEWGDTPNYYSPLGRENVNWVHVPVGGYGGIFSDEQKAMYHQMFQMLTKEETYPLYIHCVAGADRTGTLVIAIKALLGVSDNDLCMDYELTSFSVFGNRYIHGDYFEDFMKKLSDYGNEGDSIAVKFENYILSTGITPEEIETIRSLLLEDAE
ncbi:MAG: tyrosine-protein phosphatase [Thermoguttaceae bacterium]|nr:tyrosine-protein phosphatase [Thermoguttaceae bacterium]